MISRKYSTQELVKITSAQLIGEPSDSFFVDRILIDTRTRGLNEFSCFVALKTEHNDGHYYIEDAYNKGVRCFISEKEIDLKEFPNSQILLVKNSLQALQNVARFRRNEINYPIVAITGSNGKTIVKEWLYQLLSTEKKVFRSPRSYNSQIGVALSLIMLPENADIGIIEAGISQIGEMQVLETMIRPDIGILTNVHQAHLENFKSKQELTVEKLKLFKNSLKLIYRKDYDDVEKAIEESPDLKDIQLLSWSDQIESNPKIRVKWNSNEGKTKIELLNNEVSNSYEIPFEDKASIENAVHCLILSHQLEISTSSIKNVSAQFPPVAMRLQQLQGVNNCTLINDTYNSDLTSLDIALNFLNMQQQHKSKTLILSDILQSGFKEADLYTSVNQMCLDNGIDKLIGIGPKILENRSLFELEFIGYKSTNDFLNDFRSLSFFEETILIKGARKFGFERISNQLENKKHETSLEVNLSAVIENLNYFKSNLKEGVRIMGMVKAFSYGAGSFEIANVLVHHGVNYLAVAFIDEGITLRKRGIEIPIMVMNPAIGELSEMARFDLEPEVFNLNDLYIIDDYSRETGNKINIHLKVESGMHRLGFEENHVNEVSDLLKKNQNILLKSVFSHLVASDNPKLDEFTETQISKFEDFSNALNKNGIKDFHKHMLNSDGILRFKDYQFDMVRLGIGLYGMTSIISMREKLRSVLALKSRISQIKELKEGESVGYSRAFVAKKNMRIATIPVGYADGLARKLGNGKWYFRIGSKKAPILGNICMDMTMVDISEIKDLREKDEIVVYEGNKDIYKMAEIRETIAYEILTSISERVKRVFYYGD